MRIGALDGPSRFQPAHSGQPPGVPDWSTPFAVLGEQAVGTERDGDVEAVPHLDPEKVRAGHADDRERPAIEADLSGYRIRVAAQLALPECVADHSAGIGAAGLVVLR